MSTKMHAICRWNSYSHGRDGRCLDHKVGRLPQSLAQTLAVLRVAALKHRIGREDRGLYDLIGRSGLASAA